MDDIKKLNQEDVDTIDIKEIFNILLKHLRIIIVVTLVSAVIGCLFTIFMIPKKYKSEATMIVNTRLDQNSSVTYDQINSAKQLTSTYAVILKSDKVLDSVIDNLNLNETKDYKNLTAAKMNENIVTVSQVDATQIIMITALTTDPQLSYRIVSEIVSIAPQVIIDTVKAGSVEIISAPKVNEQKVSPSISKNSIISALLGLLLSVGVIVALYLLDNTFKSPDDITKHLDIPVLGIIPIIQEKRVKL